MSPEPEARVDNAPPGALVFPYECGICAQPVKIRRICVALISTSDSTDLLEVTPPFVLPISGTGGLSAQHIRNWAVLPRLVHPSDTAGRHVPESVLLHVGCFEIYKHCAGSSNTALKHLWAVTLSRYLWATAIGGHRPLPPQGFNYSAEAVDYIFGKAGLLHFAMLPREILLEIFAMTSSAPLWAAASAATIAFEGARRSPGVATSSVSRHFSETDCHERPFKAIKARASRIFRLAAPGNVGAVTQRSRLCDIGAWERGFPPPPVIEGAERLPVLRITIDSYGIRLIERLQETRPMQLRSQSTELEYIVLHERDCDNVSLVFRGSRARLEIPIGHPGFTAWDMPSPPPPPTKAHPLHLAADDSEPAGQDIHRTPIVGDARSLHKITTFPLEGITGLSFAFDSLALVCLNAHAPKQPHASLPHHVQIYLDLADGMGHRLDSLVWTYLPMPPGEQILAIGICYSGDDLIFLRPWFLVGGQLISIGQHFAKLSANALRKIYTKLAGVVCLGSATQRPLSAALVEPSLLVTSISTGKVVGFSAYSASASPNPRYREKVSQWPVEMRFGRSIQGKQTSFAPLDGVVRIDTVHEPSASTCRGMLLYYENGAQRCIGEYRIGYHVTVGYTSVAFLCLQQDSDCPDELQVSPCTTKEHGKHLGEPRRSCYRMTGIMRAQVDTTSLSLAFADYHQNIAHPEQGHASTPPTADEF